MICSRSEATKSRARGTGLCFLSILLMGDYSRTDGDSGHLSFRLTRDNLIVSQMLIKPWQCKGKSGEHPGMERLSVIVTDSITRASYEVERTILIQRTLTRTQRPPQDSDFSN